MSERCDSTYSSKHVLASYIDGTVWNTDKGITIEVEVVCRWCDCRATVSIDNPTLNWE